MVGEKTKHSKTEFVVYLFRFEYINAKLVLSQNFEVDNNIVGTVN